MDKAPKQCKVLTLSDSKVYSMNVNLNGIHDNVVDPETLQSLNDFHNPKQFKIFKIFHCDGLLLCRTWDFDSWFGTLVLAKSGGSHTVVFTRIIRSFPLDTKITSLAKPIKS